MGTILTQLFFFIKCAELSGHAECTNHMNKLVLNLNKSTFIQGELKLLDEKITSM